MCSDKNRSIRSSELWMNEVKSALNFIDGDNAIPRTNASLYKNEQIQEKILSEN